MLADEAIRLGAEIRFGANVVHVECTEAPFVRLEGGEKIYADLVVGADGKYSTRIRSVRLTRDHRYWLSRERFCLRQRAAVRLKRRGCISCRHT